MKFTNLFTVSALTIASLNSFAQFSSQERQQTQQMYEDYQKSRWQEVRTDSGNREWHEDLNPAPAYNNNSYQNSTLQVAPAPIPQYSPPALDSTYTSPPTMTTEPAYVSSLLPGRDWVSFGLEYQPGFKLKTESTANSFGVSSRKTGDNGQIGLSFKYKKDLNNGGTGVILSHSIADPVWTDEKKNASKFGNNFSAGLTFGIDGGHDLYAMLGSQKSLTVGFAYFFSGSPRAGIDFSWRYHAVSNSESLYCTDDTNINTCNKEKDGFMRKSVIGLGFVYKF